MPASARKKARYTARTARPRGDAPACTNATAGLRISAIRPGDDEQQQDFPGGFRDRPQRDERERQQHELHPARHDRARRRGEGGRRRALRRGQPLLFAARRRCPRAFEEAPDHLPATIGQVWLSLRRPDPVAPTAPAPAPARPLASSSSATSSAASAARRCSTACRCCASATSRRSSSSTARTRPAGLGITPKNADQMFAAGVDVITLGNHTYHRREIYPYLDSSDRIVRPANFLRSQPGRGTSRSVERDGVRLGVVNISGNLYLRAGRSAFTEIEVGARRARRRRPRARRRARRGDLREGGDGLAPRRPRDRRGRHAHARSDRRRARAAGRDRLHHRRRHDRCPRRRDRRQARAGDRVAAHADAGALRDLRGGPVADGGARQLLSTASGRLDRAGSDAASGARSERRRREAPSSAIITSGKNQGM